MIIRSKIYTGVMSRKYIFSLSWVIKKEHFADICKLTCARVACRCNAVTTQYAHEPHRLWVFSRNTSSICVGTSARVARADSSQQSPSWPWAMSDGAMPSSNRWGTSDFGFEAAASLLPDSTSLDSGSCAVIAVAMSLWTPITTSEARIHATASSFAKSPPIESRVGGKEWS